MATANIKIGALGGDIALLTAVPGDSHTLTNFNNDGSPAASTWLWEVLSQPTGTPDTLENPATNTATLVTNKEGTYRIKLTVNAGPNQVVAYNIIGVRQVKTLLRVPAFQEALEANTVAPNNGWWTAMEAQLQTLDRIAGDPGVFIAAAIPNSTAAGYVVYMNGVNTLKSGLPGAELVPAFDVALGNSAATMDGPLGLLLGNINGTSPVLQYKPGKVRRHGLAIFNAGLAGGWIPGDKVYCSDAGLPAMTTGTFTRTIGIVLVYDDSGVGTVYYWFDGTPQEGIAPNAGRNKTYIDDTIAAAVAAGQPTVPTVITFAGTNYNIIAADAWVVMDATDGIVNVNLPTAVGCSGRNILFKHIDTTDNAHTTTVTPLGAEKIEFQNVLELPIQGSSTRLVSNGTAWYVVG